MIGAKVKISINTGAVTDLELAGIRALSQTMEAVHTEVVQAQVIPRRTGNLQNTHAVDYTEANNGKVSLIATADYAQRVYFHPEYRFRKTENANAQAYWFRTWLPGGNSETFIPETFAELYRKEAGL